MSRMHRQSLVAYGQPLCETVVDSPAPRGTEVLVRVERCGVCHSDLHLWDGYFELGLGTWDIAAGAAVLLGLGGRVTDWHGGQDWVRSGNLLAGRPLVVESLLELAAEAAER